MPRTVIVLMGLAVAACTGCGAGSAAGERERARVSTKADTDALNELQGTWVAVESDDGERVEKRPQEASERITLVFNGNRSTTAFGGDGQKYALIGIDASQMPKRMMATDATEKWEPRRATYPTMKSVGGSATVKEIPVTPRTVTAVYEINGDVLKICVGSDADQTTPKAVKAVAKGSKDAGPPARIMTFRRLK